MFTREQFAALSFEEKMKVLDLKAKFHAKKAKTTADMERIPKNGWNDFHKYEYARESDVKDKIRPILLENHLSLSIDLISHTKGEKYNTKGGTATPTYIKMLFTIVDIETGYFEEFIHDGEATDTGDKGIYKAYSNTIKYAIMDYFLIPTGDDVEKDSLEQQPQKQQQRNQQQQQRNQQPRQQQNKQSTPQPTWKKIMAVEDEIVKISGRQKDAIRDALQNEFGPLGKYKDMDEEKAIIVLSKLHEWKEMYEGKGDKK